MASYVDGNLAVALEQEDVQSQSPRFTVVDVPENLRGRHAQAQGQTALAPLAVTAIKCAVAFVAVVAVLSLARSFLMASAFSFSYQNAALSSQLEEARSLGADLEVQQSVFGSAERVVSIATDVYGMVPMTEVAVLDLTQPAASDEALEQVTE